MPWPALLMSLVCLIETLQGTIRLGQHVVYSESAKRQFIWSFCSPSKKKIHMGNPEHARVHVHVSVHVVLLEYV